MDDLDYWRRAAELSIVQAALLVAGENPDPLAEYVENRSSDERPSGYDAAKHAIKLALLSEDIQGTIVLEASRG